MKMAARRTKVDAALEYLRTHERGVTRKEGDARFKTSNFPDIIYKLKRRGHNVITYFETGSDEYGTYRYARYVLKKETAA